jgi:hypothetical protein
LLRKNGRRAEIERCREHGATESGHSLAAIIRAFPEFFSAQAAASGKSCEYGDAEFLTRRPLTALGLSRQRAAIFQIPAESKENGEDAS